MPVAKRPPSSIDDQIDDWHRKHNGKPCYCDGTLMTGNTVVRFVESGEFGTMTCSVWVNCDRCGNGYRRSLTQALSRVRDH